MRTIPLRVTTPNATASTFTTIVTDTSVATTPMFEDWGDEKLNKYNVDIEAYDHINIKERPSMLMDSYLKKKSTLF